MVRHVDAIFSQGAFRPVEPLALPEGTGVHLSVEDETSAAPVPPTAKVHSPKLAHPVLNNLSLLFDGPSRNWMEQR